MDEFGLIRNHFAPLARRFSGSLNLTDDAAVINVPAGHELIVTKDAIARGVHFIGDEDAALIARKLLRVNLSDLAAMGATPLCYFLAIMLPKNTKEAWIKRFAAGLAQDQKEFGLQLGGGDTTSTKGKMAFSVTALGTVPKGKALKRSGAKPGDAIFVSGTLGDSALGLMSLRTKHDAFLINRYLLPQPRVVLGQKLLGIAHAAIDVSDGLVQDLGHICETSGVGATIHRHKLPLSKAAAKLIKADSALYELVLGGGDDYELLFTAPPAKKSTIKKLASSLKLPLTEIGEITKAKAVRVLDESGKPLTIKRKGFQHF